MRYRGVLIVGIGLVAAAAAPVLVLVVLYAAYRPTDRPTLDRDYEWRPRVTVLVPTFNEADLVTDRLDRLLSTAYPTDRLEVVLADDSTDDTARRAQEFFDSRNPDATLRIVRREERDGVATAINDAMAVATGEVVFRTDADARLTPDTIPEAVAALADPAVGGVTGRQTEVVGNSAVEADYRGLLSRLQAVETRIDSVFIAHGPCFAFQRETFEPLPADTVADDTAIAVAVRRGGKRVVMDPALQFAEGGVSGLRDRRTRKDRRAVGLIQQLVRNWDALGRYGGYGRVVLPLNWGLMLATPWALAVTATLATVLGLAAAGPLGLAVPLAVGLFLLLGSREALGPLQPLHAVADAYLSLLIASVRTVTGNVSATWEIDESGRDGFT